MSMIPSTPPTPGTMAAYVEEHANKTASSATEEARRLMPLVQAAGFTTTEASIVNAIRTNKKRGQAHSSKPRAPKGIWDAWFDQHANKAAPSIHGEGLRLFPLAQAEGYQRTKSAFLTMIRRWWTGHSPKKARKTTPVVKVQQSVRTHYIEDVVVGLTALKNELARLEKVEVEYKKLKEQLRKLG